MGVRNEKGQFKKGVSGNLRGRPKQEKPNHRVPAKNRNRIFEIAEEQVVVTINGERHTMTLYEGCVRKMGIAGVKGDRVAARQFVELVNKKANEDLLMKLSTRRLMDEMEAVREENLRLREKVAQRTGVVIDEAYWEREGAKYLTGLNDDARLDDGRMSLDAEI